MASSSTATAAYISQEIYDVPTVLGHPIPCDDHAVSVTLSKWSDVVAYEEGDVHVLQAMKLGYPRFKIHAYIESLIDMFLHRKNTSTTTTAAADNVYQCMILSSLPIAIRLKEYLSNDATVLIDKLDFYDVCVVYYASHLHPTAKTFWQHAGEILTSRVAYDLLVHYNMKIPPITALYSSTNETQSLTDDTHSTITDNISSTSPTDATISSTTSGSSCSVSFRSIEAEETIKKRIGSIVNEDTSSVLLTVSGMSSIYIALQLSQQLKMDQHCSIDKSCIDIVVFGFPYLDTLKMMRRKELNSGECFFYGHGNEDDLDQLEMLLDSYHTHRCSNDSSHRYIGAVFTEFPTNPLMRVSNLVRLTALAAMHDFLLIVDDTIGNFANVDLLHRHSSSSSSSGSTTSTTSDTTAAATTTTVDVRVDVLCSSLTKIFSGRGDVMAGSVIINSHGAHAAALTAYINSDSGSSSRITTTPLYHKDAMVLEYNSRSYLHRTNRINRNALLLVQYFNSRLNKDIRMVNYPVLCNSDTGTGSNSGTGSGTGSSSSSSSSGTGSGSGSMYSLLLRPTSVLPSVGDVGSDACVFEAGYGCLISIVLNDTSIDTRMFYDQLQLYKGPSLGTNYTIVCPYTLLAHYNELQWAKDYGVDATLIRISVGLEDVEYLIDRFNYAFDHSSVAV